MRHCTTVLIILVTLCVTPLYAAPSHARPTAAFLSKRVEASGPCYTDRDVRDGMRLQLKRVCHRGKKWITRSQNTTAYRCVNGWNRTVLRGECG